MQDTASQDKYVRFEEINVLSEGSSEPVSNIIVDLHGYSIAVEGFFSQDLGGKVFMIEQAPDEASFVATA